MGGCSGTSGVTALELGSGLSPESGFSSYKPACSVSGLEAQST